MTLCLNERHLNEEIHQDGKAFLEKTNCALWLDYREDLLNHLSEHSYWVQDNFLDSQTIKDLLLCAQSLEEEGLFKKAKIGKGTNKRQKSEIRSDKIYWIESGTFERFNIIDQIYGGLKELCKEHLFLAIKRYESHFAKYGVGDFYKTHKDRHQTSPSRVITCVVYLSDLRDQDGGQLILYDRNNRPQSILPRAGKVVVFDSELEHEVKPCLVERWSLTGWLRDDIHPGLHI